MKTNLKESTDINNTKRESDFKLISDELKRQFDMLMRVDDSHNVKSGIILGFIMVTIVQTIFTTQRLDISNEPVKSVLFIIGFLAILFSFSSGVVAVYPKDYDFGPEIPKLVKQWEEKKDKDYQKNICGTVRKAYKKDRELVQSKAELIKKMLWAFTIGLTFIILSRIAIW